MNNIIITKLTNAAYIAKKYCVKNPRTDTTNKPSICFLVNTNLFFSIDIFKYKYAIVKNVSIMYILWNIIVDIPPRLRPYNATVKIDIGFLSIKFNIFQINIHVPIKNGNDMKNIIYFENVLFNIEHTVCTII